MATYNAPVNGGMVTAAASNDIITGSARDDVLIGLGGVDTLRGGDGDDRIEGDGVISFAQAFKTLGFATAVYTGTTTLTGNGLLLSSMGMVSDQSIWRIRNSSTTDKVVVLKHEAGGAGGLTITIPAMSEVFVPSDNIGRHRLFLNGSQVDTKLANATPFNATATFNGIDGNDILDGGNGNDSMDGGGGSDTVRGGAGNDILTGGRGDDLIFGEAGDDVLMAEWSTNGDSYHGGEGIDTFKIDGSLVQSFAQEIDLIGGTNNWGDKFAQIENIIGGLGHDKFWGTELSNELSGRDGNDLIDGRGGNDKLYGDAGDDTLIGGAGTDALHGGIGHDNLSGGDGVDRLWGDAGNDAIAGGLGNDKITGGIGADALNGNEGVDTAYYRHSSTGVDVSLLRGTGLLGDAEGDTLALIENLSGSAFNDTLTGDNGVNRISGLSGEDKIYGLGGNDYILTGGGYDYVDGGDGIDTVTYEDSWDYVVVNLTTGKNQYGEASRDVLVNVENIVGSAFNDKITGDAGANRLTGLDGADVINGMAGIDYLFGGKGNDTLTGGSGNDVFVFQAGFGNDTITDFVAGPGRADRIQLQSFGLIDPASTGWSMTDSAAGAVLNIAGQGTITLTGVSVSQLHLDDFILS